MEKFICIHGHFYQPPRENPWLEAVELQESAAPYHDWNERITAECYAPNAHARLLDAQGRIERIRSNYSRISFNFGPTLLSWFKEKMPDIHQAVVDADRESRERFSGHGSALAQCYNHTILPLANARDKRTQVLWGIRDFASRFGRRPEGMWLPECAADNESLDALAEQGIQFTILSPFQASRVRPLDGNGDWQDVNGGNVDPSMPYQVKLPSGRAIAVFFYDAPIAQAVAFENLLANGGQFAQRLTDGFDEARAHEQLVNIATDGESYGHHFRYGDMALAYALHEIENKHAAKLTVYGEFLETHPPMHEVEIHQPSAWSCSHGVDRWKRDCGCNSGGYPHWNQGWREPLRNALDWLRDQLAPVFEEQARIFLKDPWASRDDYIAVILNRSAEGVAAFFSAHAARELSEAEQVAALRLLEMQRHAMLMFTSCGWFFDELSGIETVQVIQYAARAIQLGGEWIEHLEAEFLNRLAQAKSNVPEHQDGRAIYEKFAKPAVMTRETAAAHYAISSLFESYPEEARIYSFNVRQEDRQLLTAGNARLAIGRIKVTFEITRNSDVITYGVLYMGEHNLNCGARFYQGPEDYAALARETRAAFEQANFAEIIRIMDRHFGETNYSLKNLFRDEQYKVLNQILAATRDDIHNTYRLLTDRYTPLARFLADLRAPPLSPLAPAMEFVLNSELRRQFENGAPDIERVKSLLAECEAIHVPLDADVLSYAVKGHLDRLSDQLLKTPDDPELLQRFSSVAGLVRDLPFEVNLWKPQNTYYELLKTILPEARRRDDENSKTWVEKFLALGEQLGFRVQRD
jgi:alpha-amylase/alpha-mannosidase (GH57 family)